MGRVNYKKGIACLLSIIPKRYKDDALKIDILSFLISLSEGTLIILIYL